MWKLDFYLHPSREYQRITEEDVYNLQELLEYLQKNENVSVPETFYDQEDQNQMTAAEFLYQGVQTDISDYLMELITKQKHCKKTYADISAEREYGYAVISEGDMENNRSEICAYQVRDKKQEKCIEVNDVGKVKRYYIRQADSYDTYKEKAEECFPDLIFHTDAFKHIKKLGKCADVKEELTRHLEALNDAGKSIYQYYEKNEKEALAELESGYHIICSGKGSNEEAKFHKDMEYKGTTYTLTCNAHTKLFQKMTDQRIYFCWGRDEIKKHNIIIVRIGDHWQA